MVLLRAEGVLLRSLLRGAPGAPPVPRLASALRLAALAKAGFRVFLVASAVGWDAVRRSLDAANFSEAAVELGGGHGSVEVLVYSADARHALFFVKCAHFSAWSSHRASIVASLVCAFELAGRPLEDADVAALLRA